MDPQQLCALIAAGIEASELEVVGSAGRYEIRITSAAFEGLNQVRRQQRIYALIKDAIASGAVHAVSIHARAPSELPR